MALSKKTFPKAAAAAALDPLQNFETVTYTGGGASAKSITSLDFQPDFVWIKSRTSALSHVIHDVQNQPHLLIPNGTNALITNGSNTVTFTSNGFDLQGGASHTSVNGSADFVAWCWKAGGAAVSNTDGSITSTVSANQDAGFSIVKYTGNGGSATLGHGLNQQVEMVITKSTESTSQWMIYHKDLTGNTSGDNPYNLYFSTDGELDLTSFGSYDSFTSSVFPVTRQSAATAHNNNSNIDYIAYCFHSVDGYQKVGSYTGNSSANPVTTGFQPRFVMVKRTNAAGNWEIWDSLRNPSADNSNNDTLFANSSAAEADAGTGRYMSFDTNGFTINGDSGNSNASASTYIYLAIA